MAGAPTSARQLAHPGRSAAATTTDERRRVLPALPTPGNQALLRRQQPAKAPTHDEQTGEQAKETEPDQQRDETDEHAAKSAAPPRAAPPAADAAPAAPSALPPAPPPAPLPPPPPLGSGGGGGAGASSGGAATPTPLAAAVALARTDPGEPLPDAVRTPLERAFARDLREVRLHRGSGAEALLAGIGAGAAALGRDIFVAPTAMDEREGRLFRIAHEIAHAVQQDLAIGVTPAALGARGSAEEQAADDAAWFALVGLRVPRQTRAAPGILRRDEPVVTPASGGAAPAPVASPAVIDAFIANPTPMRMSVTLEGLYFRPLDNGHVTFPDFDLCPTAVILNVLAPTSPLPELVRRYNRDSRFPGWRRDNPNSQRVSHVRLSPDGVATTLAILDSLIDAENVALTDRQREILLTAQALNPLPSELVNDIQARIPPDTPSEMNGVLGGDEEMVRSLAPMWWDLTQAYVSRWQAWKATATPETRRAAGDALEGLINAFAPFSQLLAAIHDDTALQALPEWQVLWPNQRNGEMRGTNLYVFREAVEFVRFASSQPPAFRTLALTDAAARRSLLLGFVAMRGTIPAATSGDLSTSAAPSPYNAPALDMRIDAYPSLLPPSFSMVLNSTTTFHAQIQFMRFNDAISHAFGGWFYEWDYIKVPGDDPSSLMNTSVPPSEASRWDALSADLDRELRYAREDLARFDIVDSMAMQLGPPGLGPETLVGFNLLSGILGSVAKQSISFVTARSNEYAITPTEPGLYIARCIAGPQLSDTPTAAQFRRQPSSAWMPFWALSPERLGRELLTEDAINRRQAEERYFELYDMLSEASYINQTELEAEMERLRVSLFGDSRQILLFQRAELNTELTRLRAAPGTPQAQINALVRQIESLDIMLGMRADREGILRGRVLRLPSTLVLDIGGVISLLIEVAQHNRGRAMWHASDLTTPDSKPHDPVRGNGTLAPGYDNEDAILATLKALLEGDGSYGEGQLSVQFPPNLDRTDQTRGNLHTIRIAADHINIVLRGIESITTLVSIAAVVAAPFTGGASLVIMLPVGIVGALPSAYRLMDRAQAGTLRNDLATWMAVVDIVGAALNLGEIAAGARAAAGIGTRAGLRWAVVENGLWIAGIGGNGLGMLLMTGGMLKQFEDLRGLPPGVAAARSLEIIGQALVQIGIQAGAHLASTGRVNSAEAGLRSVGDDVNTRAAPPRVDPSVDMTPPARRPANLAEPPPELAAAMPPGVDAPLWRDPTGSTVAGGTVRVLYRRFDTGRLDPASIRVVAGPTATPAAIRAHAETVLTLREYAGVLGMVLDLTDRMRGAFGGRVRPEIGSAAWEAQLEIGKLRPIIEARMRELRRLPADDPRVTALGDDIVNLMDQVAFARAVLEGHIAADASGFIDARTPEQLRVDNLAAVRADSIMVVSESGGQWTARSADDVVAAGVDPAPGDYIFMQKGRPVVRGVATRRGSAPAHHRLIYEGGQWYLVPVDYPGAPIRRPDSSEVTLTEPGRDFDSVVARAAAASPHTESSFPVLEAALSAEGLPLESEARPLLRSWGRLINRLEIVRGDSPGMGLKTSQEIAIAAADALDPAATAGVVIGARYADYRRILRQHAVAAILGIPEASLPYDGRTLASDATARPSADQMTIYQQLVAGIPATATEAAEARFMPQSGDIGELWVQYRTIRTQLDAAHGGTGTIRSMGVTTRRLVHTTATEMDGALRVDSRLDENGPPPGDYGLESKGGGSFDRPQAVRYSDNITANGGHVLLDDATSVTQPDGTIVTTPGTSLAGMIYLADNADNASTIRNNLDANSLHPNIYVLYIDTDGRLKVMPRAVHRAASEAARAAAAATAPPAGTPPAGDATPGTGGTPP